MAGAWQEIALPSANLGPEAVHHNGTLWRHGHTLNRAPRHSYREGAGSSIMVLASAR
jgi:hypothetical protein